MWIKHYILCYAIEKNTKNGIFLLKYNMQYCIIQLFYVCIQCINTAKEKFWREIW